MKNPCIKRRSANRTTAGEVTQALGERRVQSLRLHRLEQGSLIGAPPAPGIHRDEDVGWAIGRLALDALDKSVALRLDAVDLDARLLGEAAVEGVIGLVVPGRVDVQHLLRLRRHPAGKNDSSNGGL